MLKFSSPLSWLQALLVDLDNTLYDYTQAAWQAKQALAALVSLRYRLDRNEVLETYHAIRELEGDETISSGRELRRMRIRRLLDSWPATVHVEETTFVEAFETALLSSVTWYPGAKPALDRLASLLPVLIISEGREDVGRQILDALGLKSENWRALFTNRYHVTKRDGSAFLLALEWMKLKADGVVMIGDNWTLDILGASLAGIKQIWRSNGGSVPVSTPKGFLGSINHFHEAEGLLRRRA